MTSLRIELRISSDEMLEYYRGTARTAHAMAINGKTVQFPASALQKFVTKEGVRGTFDLIYDENNKFVELRSVKNSENGLDRTA